MQWCAQAGVFYFETQPQPSGQSVFRTRTLPAAAWGLIGRQWDCNSSCQPCAYKMVGNPPFPTDNSMEQQSWNAQPRFRKAHVAKPSPSAKGQSSRNGRKHEATWSGAAGALGWSLILAFNTFPELGWVCLLAFPKEHWSWKGFKTGPH